MGVGVGVPAGAGLGRLGGGIGAGHGSIMPDGAPVPRTVVATGTSSPMSAATAEALNRRMPGSTRRRPDDRGGRPAAAGGTPHERIRHRLGAARYASSAQDERRRALRTGPARIAS